MWYYEKNLCDKMYWFHGIFTRQKYIVTHISDYICITLMFVTCKSLPCYHVAGLIQERLISIADALELRLSCTKPLIYSVAYSQHPGTILFMRPANGRWSYIVTACLIGWTHTQNDSCISPFVVLCSCSVMRDLSYRIALLVLTISESIRTNTGKRNAST